MSEGMPPCQVCKERPAEYLLMPLGSRDLRGVLLCLSCLRQAAMGADPRAERR